MWLGIDDTDSPRGGCTTWVLTELARLARDSGLDLLGPPRLVRLNPNIPWKTRGNAALAVRVGRGRGRPETLGEIGGRPILAYPRGTEPPPAEAEAFVEDAWRAVRRAAPADRGTDPALVASRGRLPAELYWAAVRDVVRVAPLERRLRALGVEVRTRGGRRGIVGASAALAWPGRRGTWELLAYRTPERVGSRRAVDRDSVVAAQAAFPELFLCHDPATRRLLVAPHTDCPVLFGLRATGPDAPRSARPMIVSEPVDRWMLFRTNQATGDHLVDRPARDLRGYRSARVAGEVLAPPLTVAGGHVRFDLRDAAGDLLACVAFEPTKTLPAVARSLVAGDRVRVWGARGRTGALHLEGIELLRLAPPARRRPPACPRCGRRTRSLGTGRGWRCQPCRIRVPLEDGPWERQTRSVGPGTYHPTPSARRHLAPYAP